MSANPVKGESSFVADGKTYTLRFTFESLVQVEQHFGKRIVRVFGDLMSSEDGPALADLRFVVWQGLRHHHPEMTVEQAGDVIFSAMQERTILAVLERAVLAAFPSISEEGAKPGPQTPPTGTGVH